MLRPRPWAIALLACLALLLAAIIANVVWIDSYSDGVFNDVPQFDNTAEDRYTGQGTFYALEWIFSGGALGCLVAWIVARARTGQPAAASGSEALVQLAGRADGYLRGLRTVLWVAGAYILLFGFILVPFTDELTIAYQDHSVGGWDGWIGLFVGLFWLVSFVAWLSYLVAVSKEIRRWRRTGTDPLGLAA